MYNRSILTCIVLIGILCFHGGAATRSFGSLVAQDSRGRNEAAPAKANVTTTAWEKDPDSVVQMVQRSIDNSTARRELAYLSCGTGNPIDDCWRCDPEWDRNRKRLADCGIGFGRDAIGGKNGRFYHVTDPNDYDAVNPRPGTLRHAVIQTEPLWIVFERDMVITLKEELIMNSFKTIDGRGVNVHIANGPCITVQYVTNIIIHGIHVHDCKPAGNAMVRDSPTHYGWRTICDGDGISISGGSHIWVDHVSLSNCADGLIDAIMGSTAITVSNSHFTHHNEVMLLGHSDSYTPDVDMQVTIAFNHFGEGLVQRMPRCRHGYFHVVNNDYTHWEMYAIGGSANPTINSQGNRFSAPANPFAKEDWLFQMLCPAQVPPQQESTMDKLQTTCHHRNLVVGLLQTGNIGRIKLYTVNATVLKAFANTGIELIVGVANDIIGNLTDSNSATEWVNENIQTYLPATKIIGIAVGNEVYTGTDTQLMANLVPAMQNIHSALVSIGADTDIIISTPHSFGVLVTSYPPSAGSFQPGLESLMEQLLALLSQIGSPLFINAYPYFTYKAQPSQIPLDYVLLEPNASAVVDQNNNVVYKNMLYAQVDAVYSALSALGYPNLEVIVTETGWPSNGDADEAGATLQNAQAYNGNLLQLLAQNKGTPLRPNVVLQAYLFALFNEDMKSGPTSERNYGLFEPNGIEVYDVGLTGSLSIGNKKAVSVGSPTGSADTPYYNISFAKETCTDISFYNHLQVLALSSFLVLLLFLP